MSDPPKVPLDGLLDSYESALSELGYSITTKLLFVRRAELIIRLHLEEGLEHLNPDTLERYAQKIDGRYFNGELTRRHYESIRREIKRFAAYAFSGECHALPSPLCGSKQKLKAKSATIRSSRQMSGRQSTNWKMRMAIMQAFLCRCTTG